MALKTHLLGAAGAALIGLALSATGASAYIACNRDGDCWHTETRGHYPGTGYSYHPDDWYFHQTWDKDHRWRAEEHHRDRGFWRNGVWVTF